MEKEQMTDMSVSDGSYSFFYRLFLLFFLVIPVTAFFLGNGWLCFGLLCFIVSSWVGVYLIPAVSLYSVWVWSHSGCSFFQYATFFLACTISGYLLFTLARKRVFVDDEPTDSFPDKPTAIFETQIKKFSLGTFKLTRLIRIFFTLVANLRTLVFTFANFRQYFPQIDKSASINIDAEWRSQYK